MLVTDVPSNGASSEETLNSMSSLSLPRYFAPVVVPIPLTPWRLLRSWRCIPPAWSKVEWNTKFSDPDSSTSSPAPPFAHGTNTTESNGNEPRSAPWPAPPAVAANTAATPQIDSSKNSFFIYPPPSDAREGAVASFPCRRRCYDTAAGPSNAFTSAKESAAGSTHCNGPANRFYKRLEGAGNRPNKGYA